MASDQFHPAPLTTDRDVRDRFLDTLRDCGSVTEAAARMGVTRPVLYRARRKYRAFADTWDRIVGRGDDALESAMLDRAINGVERVKVYANGTVETVREYPEVMALALLRARMPDPYGGNAVHAVAAAPPEPEKVMSREEFLAIIAKRPRSTD